MNWLSVRIEGNVGKGREKYQLMMDEMLEILEGRARGNRHRESAPQVAEHRDE